MTKCALVTGAAGFVGRHLTKYLCDQGLVVHGLDRPNVDSPADLCASWYPCDLTDAEQVNGVVSKIQPDYVFHLAALLKQASLADLLEVNVLGTENLLDALVAIGSKARVLVTGSSAEYGLQFSEELPIQENNPLRPLNSYGLSKVAQGMLALQYARNRGVAVVYSRTFNLIGPDQPPGMVTADFAHRIVEVERGMLDRRVRAGNLNAKRDFVDVRDAIRAYWVACSQGQPGEVYNVCSGKSVEIEHVLHVLAGYSTSQIEVEVDTSKVSSEDVSISLGSAEKLQMTTGWQPTIPLEKSLRELLTHLRQSAKKLA